MAALLSVIIAGVNWSSVIVKAWRISDGVSDTKEDSLILSEISLAISKTYTPQSQSFGCSGVGIVVKLSSVFLRIFQLNFFTRMTRTTYHQDSPLLYHL